jgi:hypothetical protein
VRRRVWKVLLGLVVAVSAAIGTAAAWFPDQAGSLMAFPGLASSYDAKESCSCRYVEGRTQLQCEQFVAQSVVPISGRVFDDAAKTVTTTALGVSSTTTWRGKREGCAFP